MGPLYTAALVERRSHPTVGVAVVRQKVCERSSFSSAKLSVIMIFDENVCFRTSAWKRWVGSERMPSESCFG